MAGESKAVRPTLAEVVGEHYNDERIRALLEDIDSAEKKVRFFCSSCKRANHVDVPDDPRRLEGLLKILEFLEGKASTVDTEIGGLTLIVERKTPSIRAKPKSRDKL